jgi:hypothetical protein
MLGRPPACGGEQKLLMLWKNMVSPQHQQKEIKIRFIEVPQLLLLEAMPRTA